MIPRRTRWNGEWLPIPEHRRRFPRLDEDDPWEELKAYGRNFEGIGLRNLSFVFKSPDERLVALFRSQLQQAAALRIVGETMEIAAPRDQDGKPAWGEGAHLAHGSPPHEAGFARVHLQMSPGEAAAARRAATAERRFPRIAEYERMGYLPRADARRLREIAATEDQVSAWLSLAERGDRAELRRRLRRARKGEAPNDAPDPGLGPRDEAAGPEPDSDHVLDLTLRLPHRDGETWDRAVSVAGGTLRTVLSVPDAIREFVSVTPAELEVGRAPARLEETVPFREWHPPSLAHPRELWRVARRSLGHSAPHPRGGGGRRRRARGPGLAIRLARDGQGPLGGRDEGHPLRPRRPRPSPRERPEAAPALDANPPRGVSGTGRRSPQR